MKIIFLGTPDFAVPPLERVLQSRHKVAAVVTQPDRVNARGGRIVFSKVKEAALLRGLPVLQYENISAEGYTELKALDADIMVTAAYGQILKQNILDLTPKGIINVHASLLPKYRGASPVQWALLAGEERVGVTIMQTALGVDCGDIILKEEIKLSGTENVDEVLQKLSFLGADLLVNALDAIEEDRAVWTPQVESDATRCRMLKKEDGLIDFSRDAKTLHNFVRGMNPWPGAYTTTVYGRLKVLRAEVCEVTGVLGRAGEVLTAGRGGLVVACGWGSLRFLSVQGENAKAMDVGAFLLGKPIKTGEVLGA